MNIFFADFIGRSMDRATMYSTSAFVAVLLLSGPLSTAQDNWHRIPQHWVGAASDVFRGTGSGGHTTRTSPSGNSVAMVVGGRIVVSTNRGATWRSISHPFDGSDSLVFYNEIGAQLVSDSLLLMNFVHDTPGYVLYRNNLAEDKVSPVLINDTLARGGQGSYHLFADSLLLYTPGQTVAVSTNAGWNWSSNTQGFAVRLGSFVPVILAAYNDSCRTLYNTSTKDFERICAPALIEEIMCAEDGMYVAITRHRPPGGSVARTLRTTIDGGATWVDGQLVDANLNVVSDLREVHAMMGPPSNRGIVVSYGNTFALANTLDSGRTWRVTMLLREGAGSFANIRIGSRSLVWLNGTLASESDLTVFDASTGDMVIDEAFPLAGRPSSLIALGCYVWRMRSALAVRQGDGLPIVVVEDYDRYPTRNRTLTEFRGIEPATPRNVRIASRDQYVCYDSEGDFHYLRRNDTSYLLASHQDVLLDGGDVIEGGYATLHGRRAYMPAGMVMPQPAARAIEGMAIPIQGHKGGFVAVYDYISTIHVNSRDASLGRDLPLLPYATFDTYAPSQPTLSATVIAGGWQMLLWYPLHIVVENLQVRLTTQHDSVIYLHRDGEADWRRIALPAGMACQSAIVRADGTILASLSSITREAGQTPVQSDLTVQRYNLSTNTWTEIEREFYRGPVVTQVGMRRLLAAPDGHVYLGTLHRGIERLSADGTSWEAVGDGALDTTQVWDFDVAADGEIAVATSKGVYALRPTTSVANDGSSDAPGDATQQLDRNRVTLMRLRPTPATTTVTVELLNVDREPSGISSLKIHDLSGRVVADHTELAQAANGTRHKELRLDVSTLDAGTYVLHAVIGSQQPTLKILVVR